MILEWKSANPSHWQCVIRYVISKYWLSLSLDFVLFIYKNFVFLLAISIDLMRSVLPTNIHISIDSIIHVEILMDRKFCVLRIVALDNFIRCPYASTKISETMFSRDFRFSFRSSHFHLTDQMAKITWQVFCHAGSNMQITWKHSHYRIRDDM